MERHWNTMLNWDNNYNSRLIYILWTLFNDQYSTSFELSKVYAVEYSGDSIDFNNIPKSVESLMNNINMDTSPKN